MKHTKLALVAASMLLLASCGGTTNPRPISTQYEKVSTAFKGVEDSFASAANARRLLQNRKAKMDPSSEAMGKVEQLFTRYAETSGSLAEEISYDTPPMAQFKYLKLAHERIGSGYQYGTKYHYQIPGSVYIDMETGLKYDQSKADASAHKYDYVFDFSIKIDVDSNNLINAAVGFDITLSKGSEHYHTQWYVGMELNYDFALNDGTYVMSMMTGNREAELPYLNVKQGYEYDHVSCQGSSIREWRKFYYRADEPLYKDAAHPSIEAYQTAGVSFTAENQKWYKDGAMRRVHDLTPEASKEFCKVFFEDLGMNDTAINPDPFLNASGTSSDVIHNIYQDICRAYGDDILYDLVTVSDHSDDKSQRVDESWPTQGLQDDGIDVPGFKGDCHFTVERLTDAAGTISYHIEVANSGRENYDRYIGALLENGFAMDSSTANAFYKTIEGGSAIGVIIYQAENIIVIMKGQTTANTPKDVIPFRGEYTGYNEVTYESAKGVATVVSSVSGDMVMADEIMNKIHVGECTSYVYSYSEGSNYIGDFQDYAKQYKGGQWKEIAENGAYYQTRNGGDYLVILEPQFDIKTIVIHVFVLDPGSIDAYIDQHGQIGPSHSEASQDKPASSQEPYSQEPYSEYREEATLKLYEVSKEGPALVAEYPCYIGDWIDLYQYGEGPYYLDKGCKNEISSFMVEKTVTEIYYKASEATTGSIVFFDAETNTELYRVTDAIGARFQGYQLASYVFYNDQGCTSPVAVNETITVGEEDRIFYCYNDTHTDYVTLTVDTYVNEVLESSRQYGVRKGKIMDNYASYSFPVYWNTAYFYDSNPALILNGETIDSNSYVALLDNSTLEVYCTNQECHVYTITNGSDENAVKWVSYDGLYEDLELSIGKYTYHISSVAGSTAYYDRRTTQDTFTTHYVYQGKIIITELSYFGPDWPYSIIGGEGYYFTDATLTTPLDFGDTGEVSFDHSFTLYVAFNG